MSAPRHNWSPPSNPSELRTERTCLRCGLREVAWHDSLGRAWPGSRYFVWGQLEHGGSPRTPACADAGEARAG
jgi:hypothetical protein